MAGRKPPNTKPMDGNVKESLEGLRGGILGRGMRRRQDPARAAAEAAAAVRRRNTPQSYR